VVAAYILGEEEREETAAEALHSCTVRGASIITLHELAHILLRRSLGTRLEDVLALLERAFTLHGVTREVAVTAARLRLSHRLPEVDALILATAVEEGYDVFYSFDNDFAELDGQEIGSTTVRYLG